MDAKSGWLADNWKILTRNELAEVLADLHAKAPRSQNARLSRVVFRLACCCGLRVSEIAQLRMSDVWLESTRPHLRLRGEATKGGKPRRVPLWWDGGTLADLTEWLGERVQAGARPTEPFVCCLRPGRMGDALSRQTLRTRFKTACKVLGLERLRTLTIHHGRHTFVSHALAGGRTLAEVRSAAGHANLVTTSIYLHVAVDDEGEVGRLFGARE